MYIWLKEKKNIANKFRTIRFVECWLIIRFLETLFSIGTMVVCVAYQIFIRHIHLIMITNIRFIIAIINVTGLSVMINVNVVEIKSGCFELLRG